MNFIHQLLIICPLVFFAGIVDAIAGGGGIIALPAYMVAQLPPHMAMGTNKFASAIGTTASVARFMRNGKIYWNVAVVSVPCALFGAFLGTKTALFIDENILRYILMVLLPFAALFVIKGGSLKNGSTTKNMPHKKLLVLSGLAGFGIGAYDGFFGPGTGTFLIMVFNILLGMDILHASGNAKIINLASNIASLATFLISGNVMFLIGIPAAICGILGHYIGSGLALKNGIKVIRPVLVLVLILLMVKVGWDAVSTLLG